MVLPRRAGAPHSRNRAGAPYSSNRPGTPLSGGQARASRSALGTATALALALGLSGLAPAPALAQASVQPAGAATRTAEPPVTLIADRVFMEGPNRLVATGNVEALRDGTRLRASRVIYDQQNGALQIEGPITLTHSPAVTTGAVGAGEEIVVLASAAELDEGFRNGLLGSARVMLGQQVQLAAQQMARVDGRYSQLYKATVSSCQVCEDGRPPLWQIRARRVIHDEDARQLYFDQATFEVLGLPVFYLPYLRLPDPSQTRATGFMIPQLLRNSQLGTGIKLPYFIRLGDQRDLTLTPFLAEQSRTLEYRYRQAFERGAISFSGALSSDDLNPDENLRGYFQAGGKFYLKRDFELKFNVEAVTDSGYLTDYDYSDRDRLRSGISLSRARRDEWVELSLAQYHSLRPTEDNLTIPSAIANGAYETRHFPARIGGELRLGLEAHAHYRLSDNPLDGPDADLRSDGRDVQRLTLLSDWRRNWTLWGGLRAQALAGVAVDAVHTAQDASLPATQTGATPMGALTLRWPMQRVSAGGSVTLIEPVAQIAWSGGTALNIANEESTRFEFDEGNLLALTRFAAPDRREHGWRGAYGVMLGQYDPSGWSARTVLGQIVQQSPPSDFSPGSGLSGKYSNLLIASKITAPGGWSIMGRGLFDPAFDVSSASARASWVNQRAAISGTYIWLGPDDQQDRPSVISEWALDGTYELTPSWQVASDIRYDVASDKLASAGMSVTYTNECVAVTLGADKRFTSSTVVTPSTNFNLLVTLRGFSAQTDRGRRMGGTCRN